MFQIYPTTAEIQASMHRRDLLAEAQRARETDQVHAPRRIAATRRAAARWGTVVRVIRGGAASPAPTPPAAA